MLLIINCFVVKSKNHMNEKKTILVERINRLKDEFEKKSKIKKYQKTMTGVNPG